MRASTLTLIGLFSLVCLGLTHSEPTPARAMTKTFAAKAPTELRVMTWNIWRGGRQDGDEVGPKRVVDVIRDSGADLIALQETYGSGEQIAKELGFHFHPRGTNVSILSRYPILEDLSVFEEFKCVGALIELPEGPPGPRRVAFFSVWLPYDQEIWKEGTRPTDPAAMRQACHASSKDIAAIRDGIDMRFVDRKYGDVPIIIAGDFNSMSHVDYSEVSREQYGAAVDWETSRLMTVSGYRDSYREVHPSIDRAADRTWTPRFPKQEQDRIDFIYYRPSIDERVRANGTDDPERAGESGWIAINSKVIDQHAEQFPSDHAAVVTTFGVRPTRRAPIDCKVVTYNVKHGRGMDGKVDLDRCAAVLRKLQPDVIGLQEIDELATRSGKVNQAAELGRKLGMHAAFGPFMDFQGGRYGMAVLSRYPIRWVRTVALPRGNESRIALVVEVRLPNGDPLVIVNVHFDWMKDDAFRFSQATTLVDFLTGLHLPYILLGDFNDQPGSRTLDLFHQCALEVPKPKDNANTFSSTKPEREIDFIFVAPAHSWKFGQVTVIDEPLASDHRPVSATLQYRGFHGGPIRHAPGQGD